jgi:DNA polymerase-3 subunit gamma/tau
VTGLATKHRPRRLRDLVGQRHVTSVLQKALNAQRLPHQLLFSGGSGLGKTTVARVVAAALLCERPQDADACSECDSCRDIFEPGRIHPDVVEFDAASNGQKEQIRELAARALTAPVRGSHRVYIIDEAHGLSQGGGQAFLKLLEEPPAHVIFMLATTDPEKMLRTNRGRCVEFELARPSDEELSEHLQRVASSEGWELDTHAARAVLQATDPALGVRGLLMTLEKLADLLSWGAPSIDEVTATLGLAPMDLVDETWAAIIANDKQRALLTLEKIRKRTSDASLRRALIDRARQALAAAFLTGEGDLALWRFEQLLTAPAGQLWTDLAVAKSASSHTGEEPGAIAALLNDALSAASALEAKVAAVADRNRTGEMPAEASPLGGGFSDQALHEEVLPQEAPQAQPESAPTPVPERLLELLAVRSKIAAAILRTCTLEESQGSVRVVAPDATIARLRKHATDVRAAAAECGVALTISPRSS